MSFFVATDMFLRIDSTDDVLLAIGLCYGASGLLLTEADLAPSFFDLRSGLAGELFQKCTMYNLRLALVVVDLSIYSPRVSELAFEHQTHRTIRFFDLKEKALAWLN